MTRNNKGNSVVEAVEVEPNGPKSSEEFFDNLIWLTCKDAAIYLRKFRKDGSPSLGAIRNLIYRGHLRARKWAGCIYIKKSEIDNAIELSLV